MSSILVVDDHTPIRHGLKSMLVQELPGTVFGEASDGREALAQALCKNVLDGGQIENARRLAYYAEAATTALAGLDDVTVQRATWRFPSPARVGPQQ